ncbi:MAG TPA: nitrate reductase cytochrome c-type subunit [Cellvibrionaceae bacterium]
MKKLLLLLLIFPIALIASDVMLDAPAPDGLRPGGTLDTNAPAPDIAAERSGIKRSTRNWPEQPPVIPHSIRDYQVDKNFNQCLMCHSRSQSVTTGAPMVSITHYWNRDSQPLAAVSPRRYFCTQCHVPQHDINPAKISRFQGIDQVLQNTREQAH